MTRTELTKKLAEKLNISHEEAKDLLKIFLNEIREGLKRDKEVKITGFGKFFVRERSKRPGKDPQTGENITIPAFNIPKFKAGKHLKDAVN